MKTAVVALTAGGYELADTICDVLDDCSLDTRKLTVFDKIASLWKQDVDAIICVMATGIVVRALAPLCSDKQHDPCVLVLDEKGEFVISLLSGHIGGGNSLTRRLAVQLDAQAVITTASDVTGHTALDLWALKNNLLFTDKDKLTSLSAKLVNSGSLTVFTDCEVEQLPQDFIQISTADGADIIVSDYLFPESESLFLRPCNICIGIGCNRGTEAQAFEIAIGEILVKYKISPDSVACYASIDLKNDEIGMLEFIKNSQRPIFFYTKDELNSVDGISSSAAVLKATGAKGVAEPAALLAAQKNSSSTELIARKHKWKDVTAAIATRSIRLQD